MEPPFIGQLQSMLDGTNDEAIEWGDTGDTIVIHPGYIQRVLVSINRSSSLSSFIRQLNFFGFRRVRSPHGGTQIEYKHPLFVKGRDDLIAQIRRKTAPDFSEKPEIEALRDELACHKNLTAALSRIVHELDAELASTNIRLQSAGFSGSTYVTPNIAELTEHHLSKVKKSKTGGTASGVSVAPAAPLQTRHALRLRRDQQPLSASRGEGREGVEHVGDATVHQRGLINDSALMHDDGGCEGGGAGCGSADEACEPSGVTSSVSHAHSDPVIPPAALSPAALLPMLAAALPSFDSEMLKRMVKAASAIIADGQRPSSSTEDFDRRGSFSGVSPFLSTDPHSLKRARRGGGRHSIQRAAGAAAAAAKGATATARAGSTDEAYNVLPLASAATAAASAAAGLPPPLLFSRASLSDRSSSSLDSQLSFGMSRTRPIGAGTPKLSLPPDLFDPLFTAVDDLGALNLGSRPAGGPQSWRPPAAPVPILASQASFELQPPGMSSDGNPLMQRACSFDLDDLTPRHSLPRASPSPTRFPPALISETHGQGDRGTSQSSISFTSSWLDHRQLPSPPRQLKLRRSSSHGGAASPQRDSDDCLQEPLQPRLSLVRVPSGFLTLDAVNFSFAGAAGAAGSVPATAVPPATPAAIARFMSAASSLPLTVFTELLQSLVMTFLQSTSGAGPALARAAADEQVQAGPVADTSTSNVMSPAARALLELLSLRSPAAASSFAVAIKAAAAAREEAGVAAWPNSDSQAVVTRFVATRTPPECLACLLPLRRSQELLQQQLAGLETSAIANAASLPSAVASIA